MFQVWIFAIFILSVLHGLMLLLKWRKMASSQEWYNNPLLVLRIEIEWQIKSLT